jgi:hypothetical protein
MIVWFNCKITDVRLNPATVIRYNLRHDSRFDVAKYSFASYAPLEPLVSKYIFDLELADGFAGREQEMGDWIRSLFPAEKLILNWKRRNRISEWRELRDMISVDNDPFIFVTGNEDHIFMDSNINAFTHGLNTLAGDPRVNSVLATTHFPETIRASYYYGGTYNNGITQFEFNCNDGMRVMRREFFDWYIDRFTDENALVFRLEDWNRHGTPPNIVNAVTKEQFIHFDGYSHVKIGPEVSPPIEIPPGFFEGEMVIRYGFNDRDPNCVNINPASELYTVDAINGADYKFTLDDIPAFWRSRIKEVRVAEGVDHKLLAHKRDVHIINKTRVNIDYSHVGVMLDSTNIPPAEWLQPFMLVTKVTNS